MDGLIYILNDAGKMASECSIEEISDMYKEGFDLVINDGRAIGWTKNETL